jgi:uncharacterized protein (TIGR02300 family)
LGVTKPEWGTKRDCGSCGKRFYDLKRSPIICPQCDTTVTVRKSPTNTPKAAAPIVEAKPEKTAVAAKPTKADGDGPWGAEDNAADGDEDIGDDIDVAVEDDDDDDDDIDDEEAEALLVDASDLDEEEDELDVVKVRGDDAGDD